MCVLGSPLHVHAHCVTYWQVLAVFLARALKTALHMKDKAGWMLLMLQCAADELCDPEDTQQSFVEELIRLPCCFLCYTPATGYCHTHS